MRARCTLPDPKLILFWFPNDNPRGCNLGRTASLEKVGYYRNLARPSCYFVITLGRLDAHNLAAPLPNQPAALQICRLATGKARQERRKKRRKKTSLTDWAGVIDGRETQGGKSLPHPAGLQRPALPWVAQNNTSDDRPQPFLPFCSWTTSAPARPARRLHA